MTDRKTTLVERLFAEHGGSLQAFLTRRVRRQPIAAELAQEVYVRMLRVPDMSAVRNPEAYLFTVASNLAKELPIFGGELDTERRVKRLREVLEQLPPKCRAAVVLQYWHGLSYQEIAARLGISTNMVKKYLRQALTHCRRRMSRLE